MENQKLAGAKPVGSACLGSLLSAAPARRRERTEEVTASSFLFFENRNWVRQENLNLDSTRYGPQVLVHRVLQLFFYPLQPTTNCRLAPTRMKKWPGPGCAAHRWASSSSGIRRRHNNRSKKDVKKSTTLSNLGHYSQTSNPANCKPFHGKKKQFLLSASTRRQ